MDLLSNNSGLLDENKNFLPANYNNSVEINTPSLQSISQQLLDKQKDIQDFLRGYYRNSSKLNSSDEKAIYLMNRLQTELDLTKAQAAGVAGNIWEESKFNPKAVGDSGAAHGIAQWHPNRRKGINMLNTSYEDQVTHMINELKGSEKKALSVLKTANTPQQAAAIFDQLYERSNGKSRKNRENKASKYFNMI